MANFLYKISTQEFATEKEYQIDAVFSLVSTMYSELVDTLRVQISICCKSFCTEIKICPLKPIK